jgi:ATP-dependent RNA helicase RhlE
MHTLMKRALKRSPVKAAPKKSFGAKRTNSYAKPRDEAPRGRRVERTETPSRDRSFDSRTTTSSRGRDDSRSSFGSNSTRPSSTFRDRSSQRSTPTFRDRTDSRSISSRASSPSFRDRTDSRPSFGGSEGRSSSFGRDRSNIRPSFGGSNSRPSSTFRDRSESRVSTHDRGSASDTNGPAPLVSFYQNDHSSSSSYGGRSSSNRGSSSRFGSSNRGSSSFGGGSSRGNGGGRGKRGFRGSYIDERMFVNKGTTTTEMQDYEAKNAFADFAIADALATNLVKRGYINPSPIQDQAIPAVLEGKDVIGIAATGTGKTAAFLIPLINKIEKDRNQKVMILTPTRELALQIQKEFYDFTENMQLYSVTCVGGSPIYPQIKQLGLGVHVVVGTPGRVKDLIARGKIKMANYESIVLDEADRMLDMGFIDDMTEILSLMPKTKQALFFSATFNDKVRALCGNFLNNPVTISVKTRDTSGSVDQDVVRVITKTGKVDQLHEILNKGNATKVLIFREMKRSVDELTDELSGRGIKVLGLHGDMRNRERERAVHALKEGHVQVLIATDVAARGIHISDITHVINYDIPNDYETYIHRIGRTGRGVSKGIALTFI